MADPIVPINTDPSTQDPSIKVFDDGSSIQTFDDGSQLITDSEGNVTSIPAPQSTPIVLPTEDVADTVQIELVSDPQVDIVEFDPALQAQQEIQDELFQEQIDSFQQQDLDPDSDPAYLAQLEIEAEFEIENSVADPGDYEEDPAYLAQLEIEAEFEVENSVAEPATATWEESGYPQDDVTGVDDAIAGQTEIPPLEEPPLDPSEFDENAGLDEAIAARENALQEPPVMSDEEVDQYLNNYNTDEEDGELAPLQEPPGTEVEDPQPEDPDFITSDDGSVLARDTNGNWVAYDSEGNEYVPGSNQQLPRNQIEASPNSNVTKDWRVKLRLAKAADYLYKAEGKILEPLKETDGVVFPYMPQISYNYQANYDATDIAHSNYKFYQYRNSEVSEISITADFTAQDVKEATYMLAVIHFFRCVTKMFYGQDVKPPRGVPPPLCFLSGLGPYQFDGHPLLVRSFQYSLPNDVDYVRTGTMGKPGEVQNTGITLESYKFQGISYLPGLNRLQSSGLTVGAISEPDFDRDLTREDATYVPTKLQVVITCVPIITRKDVAKTFSLERYAKGQLFKRGIW